MTTIRLVTHWVVGTVFAALFVWGFPAMQSRSTYQRQADARRSDSLSAVRQADSVRRANGDTVAGYVFVPPDPLGLDKRRAAQYERTRNVFLTVIAFGLLWNTGVWWRGRKANPGAAAT